MQRCAGVTGWLEGRRSCAGRAGWATGAEVVGAAGWWLQNSSPHLAAHLAVLIVKLACQLAVGAILQHKEGGRPAMGGSAITMIIL